MTKGNRGGNEGKGEWRESGKEEVWKEGMQREEEGTDDMAIFLDLFSYAFSSPLPPVFTYEIHSFMVTCCSIHVESRFAAQ